MKYKFNKNAAATIPVASLFAMQLALIEVQRKATLYRAGIKSSNLWSDGICGNVDEIMDKGGFGFQAYKFRDLFFRTSKFPIEPYHPVEDNDQEDGGRTEFRWGHNSLGDQRMELLRLMIADLSNYLLHRAV